MRQTNTVSRQTAKYSRQKESVALGLLSPYYSLIQVVSVNHDRLHDVYYKLCIFSSLFKT